MVFRFSGSIPMPVSENSKGQTIFTVMADSETHRSGRRELHGVAQQIEQHWRTWRPSTNNSGWNFRVDLDREMKTLAASGFGNDMSQIHRQLVYVGWRRFHFHASGFDLRQIENVVDQVQQMRTALGNRIERFALICSERAGALQKLRIAQNSVERWCAVRDSCWPGIRSSPASPLRRIPWHAGVPARVLYAMKYRARRRRKNIRYRNEPDW
jgi:hypothetical protein